jgi:hypothetical protein
MIDVSDILGDPDFAMLLSVKRSSGSWARGGFAATTSTLTISGYVNAAASKDIEQVPEGDRATGVMTFYSPQPLYVTQTNPAAGLSDVITYNGEDYRLMHVWNRSANGFYKAVGVRIIGS